MSKSKLIKQAITLTNSAIIRVKYLLSQNKDPNIIGLKLSTKQRGCNGTTITMDYAKTKQKLDIHEKHDNVNIFIDSKALFSIIGTEMDYIEDELKSEFIFNNPNAKSICGCGESFQT